MGMVVATPPLKMPVREGPVGLTCFQSMSGRVWTKVGTVAGMAWVLSHGLGKEAVPVGVACRSRSWKLKNCCVHPFTLNRGLGASWLAVRWLGNAPHGSSPSNKGQPMFRPGRSTTSTSSQVK